MKSFGIEDPTINHTLRAEDPLLLQGPDLEFLSTPPLQGGRSASLGGSVGSSSGSVGSGNSSVVYPLSLDGQGSPPLPPRTGVAVEAVEGAPPALPPRRSGEMPRILSEDVENPPVEEVTRHSSEGMSRSGSVAGKPPLPPRRSPRIGHEETTPRQSEEILRTVEEKTPEVAEATEAVVPVADPEDDNSATPSPHSPILAPSPPPTAAATSALLDPDLLPPAPKASNLNAFNSRASVLLDKPAAPVEEEHASPVLEAPLSPGEEEEGFQSSQWGVAAEPATVESATPSEAETDSFEDAEDAGEEKNGEEEEEEEKKE